MTNVKYLEEKDGTKFYPVAHGDGVYINTTTTLNQAIGSMTITAGSGLTGGGSVSGGTTISLSMPSTYTGTSMPTVVNNHEPIVYVLVSTTATSLANQTCPITLDEGQQCNVIYKTSAACTIPFATSGVITADGQQLSITTAAGGYAEVNYIKLGGNVFLRGV